MGTTGFLLACACMLGCAAGDGRAHAATAATHVQARVAAAAAAGCSNGICLALTVTTDPPPACGTATSLAVAIGTRVNFCYTVTNQTGGELDYHTLANGVGGSGFWLLDQPLSAGASYRYNQVATIFDDTAVASTWTAQDALPGYAHTVTSGGFIGVSASGTALDIHNEAFVGVTLPFAFEFYGRTSNRLCVSSDGFALFDLWPCPIYAYYAGHPLPAPGIPAPALMALWEELLVGDGEVYAATLGTAPNRRFVIEWYDRPPYASTDGFTFEIILDESSGRVSFEYQDVDTTPSSWGNGALATIGLQASSSLADPFSYGTPSVTSGSGIEWNPGSVQTFSASAAANVTASGSELTLAPTVLRARAVSGEVTEAALTLANGGSAQLVWSSSETRATQARPVLGATGAQVPVFAEDLRHGSFVRFDAASPTALATIAATDYQLTAGDFVDNDPSRLFALDASSSTHRNTLVAVDTSTGVVSDIGAATPLGSTHWTGLQWDPATGRLYAVATDCGLTNSTLYTIDRGTGTATRIAPISSGGQNCIMDIAIDALGRLFGIDFVNGGNLFRIDKDSGQAQSIGPLGVNADGEQGLGFDDASGILYWARNTGTDAGGNASEIRTINTSTGATTLIGTIGTDAPRIDAFAIGTVGDCSDPQVVPWLSLQPAGGTVAAHGQATASVEFDASGLDAGTYNATICFASNDPQTPIQQLPVEFDVIGVNDVIFRNGFDGD